MNSNQQRKLLSPRSMFCSSGKIRGAKGDLKVKVEDEECGTNHLLREGEVDQHEKSTAETTPT